MGLAATPATAVAAATADEPESESREETMTRENSALRDSRLAPTAAIVAVWLALLPMVGMAAGSGAPKGFDSPDHAVQALVEANRADQPQRILDVLGRDGRKLVFSGDAVADKRGRGRFVAAYDKAHRIELQGESRAVLVIGEKEWPFPIPLAKNGSLWRFDTRSGVEEILDRRIGRNELGAIEVCRAYVDAQREYATADRNKDGLLEYAQHIKSSPGQRDGLYWPAADGEAQSPMGPLIARARAEGYAAGSAATESAEPYHGYFYRILKRQGSHAADGARDYLVDGRMIGGFALVAFPARHGDSGIMSFVVNQDGVVYQKDLGRDSEAMARQMSEFDPDASWSKVPAAGGEQ
jgi:hypothetical protein